MCTKHRVTFVHPISNPRDAAGQIGYAVLDLDLHAILASADKRELGRHLRNSGVLWRGSSVREYRIEDNRLVVFPRGARTLHAAIVELTPTYEPTTADKARALKAAASETSRSPYRFAFEVPLAFVPSELATARLRLADGSSRLYERQTRQAACDALGVDYDCIAETGEIYRDLEAKGILCRV